MISIDREAGTLTANGRTMPLDSAEAFDILSDAWIDAALRVKHQYTFTWLGRPVIQLPDDLMRLQELIYAVKPDVILETGVAHGGSLIFHATLCRVIGRGRVIGVDILIRPHNRQAIEQHELAPLITLIEGSSIDPATVNAVHAHVQPGERVLVILDSNHTRAHVLAELEAYAPLVSEGSYVVAMDGRVMEVAATSAVAADDWATNNPNAAVREFAAAHPEFAHEDPALLFNESVLPTAINGFRGGVLRRL